MRSTGLDLRGYQRMRLVLNVGGQAGLTGTILYYRCSVDAGATWYDTDAAIQLDGSTNQTFWGNRQPIPPMLRQSIDTTVALFGSDGDGSTPVELVDWFVLDIRGIDHTSAALAAAAGGAGGDRRSGRDRAALVLAEGHRRHRRRADPMTARSADQSGTSSTLALANNTGWRVRQRRMEIAQTSTGQITVSVNVRRHVKTIRDAGRCATGSA